MNKPKGGRGKRADYDTKVVRLPEVAAKYGSMIANNTRQLIEDGKEERELYFTDRERTQAIEIAKRILTKKSTCKQALTKLLQELYDCEINL